MDRLRGFIAAKAAFPPQGASCGATTPLRLCVDALEMVVQALPEGRCHIAVIASFAACEYLVAILSSTFAAPRHRLIKSKALIRALRCPSMCS